MARIKAQDVADYILYTAQEAGDPITNLKLQKLLYYSQGYHLAINDSALFSERIEAWVHGPVVPDVYHVYKAYRWKPITKKARKPSLSSDVLDYLDLVINTFMPIDAFKLELMTHQEYPWLKARGKLEKDAICTREITTNNMRDYFKKVMDDA